MAAEAIAKLGALRVKEQHAVVFAVPGVWDHGELPGLAELRVG